MFPIFPFVSYVLPDYSHVFQFFDFAIYVQEAIHLNRLLRLYPPGERWRARGRPSTRGNPGVTDGTE